MIDTTKVHSTREIFKTLRGERIPTIEIERDPTLKETCLDILEILKYVGTFVLGYVCLCLFLCL